MQKVAVAPHIIFGGSATYICWRITGSKINIKNFSDFDGWGHQNPLQWILNMHIVFQNIFQVNVVTQSK